jgi:hypothetical protein
MKHTQYLAVVREYETGSFYENCFYNIDEAIDFASEIADCIKQYGRGEDNPELYEDVNMSIYKLIFESELDIPSPRDLYLYKRFIINNGALRLVDDNEVKGDTMLGLLRTKAVQEVEFVNYHQLIADEI